MSNDRIRIAAVLLPTAIILSAQSAHAQSSSTLASNVHGHEQRRKLSAPPFPSSRLDKAFDLPNIPDYPKYHKFVGGDSCNMTSGLSCNQCFSVNEEKQAVLDWYAQALQSYGWQNIQTSQHSVSAKNRGSSCNIMTVSDTAARRRRTLVTISYFGGSLR
jgi:hypothetical protein